MTTTRAKSKKAVLNICSEISNKISTRGALSVVETTRQNVLEAFPLPNNRNKLPLIATEAIFSSLAGFSPVKVLSKKHIWISLSVASTPTKSPKVFNNRPVNKLVFPSIDSTLGVASTTFLKKWSKRPKVQKNKISIVSSGTSSKMGQDQLLAVLPNVVSSDRLLPVLEAKQSPPVGSPVLGNWADQMETEISSPLISGAIFSGAWETITSYQRFAKWMASILMSDATFKIKLAHVKAVFYSVHLATLKIAKSLVVFESGSSFAAVVLHDIPLGVSAANIKTALGVFGEVAHVVLKPAGVWQYMVVYFKKLDAVTTALNYWLILVGKDSKTPGCRHCFRCQEVGHLAADYKVFPKVPKVFKSYFVGSASYVKTAALSGFSEFPPLVASSAASAVGFRLDSLEKQISDLAVLVKSIVESVGFLVALVSCLLDNNVVKAVQVEKDIIFMKSAANNFANLIVEVFKDIACLRSEVDFGSIDYDSMLAAKSFFLSEDTIEHIIALW
ncbi:hypothetical protein G9A89_022519 [Geosiphon pyriformis]|nr:hypothetical protein G9A89_022519 [Geosiphon pyriformis]